MLSRKYAESLDQDDPLQAMRKDFYLPKGKIYLGANTLGASPLDASAKVQQVTHNEWGQKIVSGWTECDWINLPTKIGDRIGTLLGAAPKQVLVTDSTSVNLFKALHAGAAINPTRRILLTETSNFSSNSYILSAVANQRGLKLRSIPREELHKGINNDVAVITATDVDYVSGERLDIQALSTRAKESNVVTVWDLSHSAGILPIELDNWGVNFAVGCTYKYLSGGPGSPAFIYVGSEMIAKSSVILPGWLGHLNPFSFEDTYLPSEGIKRFLIGTPPIISMSILETSLDAIQAVSLEKIWNKSVNLTNYFMHLVENSCLPLGIDITTPREPKKRGGHVALCHENSYALMQALIDQGVIGDFRPPNTMRFGFGPLYTRYTDVWDAATTLYQILNKEIWRDSKYNIRKVVT